MKFLSSIAKLVILLLVFSFMPANTAQAFEPLPQSLRWELLGQSGEIQYNALGYPYGVHYVQAGDTVYMSIAVKNHSRNPRAQVWYGKSNLLPEGPQYPNAHAIGLGTWDPMDHTPSFLDPSSFVINGNRLFYYDGRPINKGETVTFYWEVKVANEIQPGTYNLVLSLVREFDEWGLRVNPDGTNHRYRSILWKFVVGGVYSPDASMRVFTDEDNGKRIDFARGVNFQIKLRSQGDGGYEWKIEDYDSGVVKFIKKEQLLSDPGLVGDSGYEVFTFQVMSGGATSIRLISQRPWSGEIGNTFVINQNTPIYTLRTYSLPGTDYVFDYPVTWEVVRKFGDGGLGLDDTTRPYSGDYDMAIGLYPSGTGIDQAIEQFDSGLNSFWGNAQISFPFTNAYGRQYKYVIHEPADGSGSPRLINTFVQNEHNFVVQVGYPSFSKEVGDIITKSIR